MKPLQSWMVGDYRVSIHQDTDCDSPDAWGITDVFLGWCEGRSYSFGRKGFPVHWEVVRLPERGWRSASWYDSLRHHEDYPGYVIVPVRVIDHGMQFNISVDYERPTAGVFIEAKSDLEQLANIDAPSPVEQAEVMVEVWNQYLEGDTYGFTITHSVSGECVDSLWGIYGLDEAEKSAQHLAEWHVRNTKEGAA